MRETELLETWLADPGLAALATLPQMARRRDPVEFLLGAIPPACVASRLEAARDVGLLPRLFDVDPSPPPGTEDRSVCAPKPHAAFFREARSVPPPGRD